MAKLTKNTIYYVTGVNRRQEKKTDKYRRKIVLKLALGCIQKVDKDHEGIL